MVGTAFQYDVSEVKGLSSRMSDLGTFDTSQLLDAIGALVAEQTRERLINDKESPDGIPWLAWSENYAETRHAGHSLLIGEGSSGLEGSIQHIHDVDSVEIGSNLVYAAIHQFGGAEVSINIPAREYLGLSSADASAVHLLMEDSLQDHVNGVLR